MADDNNCCGCTEEQRIPWIVCFCAPLGFAAGAAGAPFYLIDACLGMAILDLCGCCIAEDIRGEMREKGDCNKSFACLIFECCSYCCGCKIVENTPTPTPPPRQEMDFPPQQQRIQEYQTALHRKEIQIHQLENELNKIKSDSMPPAYQASAPPEYEVCKTID